MIAGSLICNLFPRAAETILGSIDAICQIVLCARVIVHKNLQKNSKKLSNHSM